MKSIIANWHQNVARCLGLVLLGTLCPACVAGAVGDDSVDSEAVDTAVAPLSYNPIPPLNRLYSLYNATTTDQLLTQNPGEVPIGGGAATGDVIYLERQHQPTTRQLRRFYKGAPQNEHFYTTSQAEAASFASQGWTDEGNVGEIYTEQVPGSVPLYRLKKLNVSTGDLVHRYTLSASVKSTLQSQGYTYEGVTGYVYTSAVPTVPGGYVLGARCGPNGCNVVNGQNYFFGTYVSVDSIGARPSGATKQVMSFRIWTPDMFATTSDPYSTSGEHLVFSPRGISQVNLNDLHDSTFHGIGLAVGAYIGCSPLDNAFIEEWWPIPSGQALHSSYSFDSASNPNTCGTNALHNRTWYDVTVSVSNTGVALYTVYSGGVLVASSSAQYGASPLSESPFNSSSTGYFLTNATTAGRDYTVYVTNFSATWAQSGPSCGNCASGQDCHCGDICWAANLACP